MKKNSITIFFIELARSSPFVFTIFHIIYRKIVITQKWVGLQVQPGESRSKLTAAIFNLASGTDFTTVFFSVDCHVDFDFK